MKHLSRLAACLLALTLTACTAAETAVPAATAPPTAAPAPTAAPTAAPQAIPLPYDDLSYVPEFAFQQKQTYQPDEYNRLYLDTYSFNDRTVLVGAEDETAALRHILEINETLPEGEKIRAVSVSAAPGDRDLFENADLWRDALAEAEAAGLLVLTAQGAAAGSARLTLSTSTFDLTRRDSPAACKTGLPNDSGMLASRKSPFCLGLPCAYRTVAEEYVPGQCGYRYDAVGGLSWGIPYCVGVMALGWQVAPALTNEEMLQTLLDTAAPNADGLRIIDPVHFIETLEREYAS